MSCVPSTGCPRSIRFKARELEKAYMVLENELKRSLPTRRWPSTWACTVDELNQLLQQMSFISLVALDELWNIGGEKGDKVSLVDTLEDSRVKDPSQTYEIEEMKRILADAINRLPEREKIVISLYYYEGLTLREIGEVLGVTESRVCQMHDQGTDPAPPRAA